MYLDTHIIDIHATLEGLLQSGQPHTIFPDQASFHELVDIYLHIGFRHITLPSIA